MVHPRSRGGPLAGGLTGAVLLISACSAHPASPTAPPGGGPALRPAAVAPVPPAAVGAEPFGVPVQLTPHWSVVVRDLRTFTPTLPIPGSAGTPVQADMFFITPPRTPSTPSVVTLTDPATGRSCRPGPAPGSPAVVTSGPHAPNRIVGYQVSFVCPLTDPGNLLLRLQAGAASLVFYGPVS